MEQRLAEGVMAAEKYGMTKDFFTKKAITRATFVAEAVKKLAAIVAVRGR